MMEFVDSHCHLNMLDLSLFDGSVENVLRAAQDNGITQFLNVSVDLETFPDVLNTAKQFENVFASVGVHPSHNTGERFTSEQIVALAEDKKIVAIGETGLDYHYNEGDLTWQRDRFREHIRAARTVNKPLIIHTRDARSDTIEIMQEEGAHEVGGVMHCFTETLEMASAALDLNFYISFSGIVTFKNAKELQAVCKTIPLDRMLIETDSPYLAPTPHRGKPNQPAFVKHVAEFIAELRDEPLERIAEQTTKNFRRLFAI